jgi:hypothetical protein
MGGYYDMSQDPWTAWKQMYETLAGGKATSAREPMTNAAQLPTLATFPLDTNPSGFNPSLAMWQGRMMAIVRTVQRGITVNMMGEVRDRRLLNPRRVNEPRGFRSAYGIEDCRLFVLDDSLWAVVTYGDGDSKKPQKTGHVLAKMAVGKLTPQGDFEFLHCQDSPRHEKNWGPIVDQDGGKDRLRLLYAVNSPVVIGWDAASGKVTPAPKDIAESTGHLRGGSPLLPFKDGWLAVVHGVADTKDKMYTHRFVAYDKDIKSAKVGRPFYFQRRGCEFAAGLIQPGGPTGDFVISYGVDDNRAFACEVASDTVEEFLEPGT